MAKFATGKSTELNGTLEFKLNLKSKSQSQTSLELGRGRVGFESSNWVRVQ
jgi:hypothetical protein